jgi:hypothetical protein
MADQPLTLAVFEEFQRKIFERFDSVGSRFDAVDASFDAVDARFDAVDARLDGHDQRFVAIAAQFDVAARRFDAADRRFDLLDARIDALSDQVARQTDAVLHRLLSLEDEITAVKAGLGRLELQVEQLGARVGGVEAAVLRLDERLSRVEKRIDDLGAAEPHSALSADVQALRGPRRDAPNPARSAGKARRTAVARKEAMRNATRRALIVAVAALAVLSVVSAQPLVEPATLVLRNGHIATVDDAKPQAQALAARGDTLVAIGTNEEIAPYVGPQTRVIDLQGRRAIPGFIEAHGHFTGVGEARIVLNLRRVKNWDEVVAMVRTAAAEARPGEWIRGRGWHQDKWDRRPQPAVEGFPTHHSLSAAAPNNPVILAHASGHASFANAKALELGGITRDTKNPPGARS